MNCFTTRPSPSLILIGFASCWARWCKFFSLGLLAHEHLPQLRNWNESDLGHLDVFPAHVQKEEIVTQHTTHIIIIHHIRRPHDAMSCCIHCKFLGRFLEGSETWHLWHGREDGREDGDTVPYRAYRLPCRTFHAQEAQHVLLHLAVEPVDQFRKSVLSLSFYHNFIIILS